MASKTQESYDVLVVGSGASGGWAAKRLAEAGVKVALVDAGRPLRITDLNEHGSPLELPYRGLSSEVVKRTRPTQSECYACTERNYDWFANDLEEPYTTAKGKPFSWQGRMRVTGGRTVVWGRQSYRMGDLDFKAASHDGFGEDWPLSYADLAPYYDLVEDYVGISGLAEGLYELPDSRFHPAMPFKCGERRLRERVKSKLGWTVTIGRVANITRSLNGRAPCHYCGPCYWGCVTNSYFNSAFTTVADALASGNCTHVPNAMVYKVLTDPGTNRATGVLYIDRVTREAREIRGRAVVLSAQALESTRILLNSKNAQNPGGLANSSGAVGHYLMDHLWVAGGATGEFPGLEEKPSLDGPNRPNGIYVVRFRNTKDGPRSKDFMRGYGFQGGQGTGFSFDAPGFGDDYKRGVKNPESSVRLVGFGECLPYFENHVEIDPSGQVDAFGIPILKVNMGWGDNERKMIPDMAVSAAEMMDAAGAKNIEPFAAMDRVPGFGIHELGVARMGSNPKTSVLNQFQQAHDVKNLFVMDGAGFTSGACQNPTLTIMALTVRSSDYLLRELKRGSL
ncbi:MAG TPA: GMC family oxidoreductase [Vicinamibacteria bacterium]|nr:GMC family oxidoreductase [Vicinamibacteria bacterium]